MNVISNDGILDGGDMSQVSLTGGGSVGGVGAVFSYGETSISRR